MFGAPKRRGSRAVWIVKEILWHSETMRLACVGMRCLEPKTNTLVIEIIDFGMRRHVKIQVWAA